jgi:predicted GIY-YIG superfamily endonuclease
MSFWIYMLLCGDGSFYIGHTDDLEKRVSAHSLGEASEYTRIRLPIGLAFSQEVPTRDEAIQLERKIKGWSRAKKQALVTGNWGEMRRTHRAQDLDRLRRGNGGAK